MIVGERGRRTRFNRVLSGVGVCRVRICGRCKLGIVRIENSEIEDVAGELDRADDEGNDARRQEQRLDARYHFGGQRFVLGVACVETLWTR